VTYPRTLRTDPQPSAPGRTGSVAGQEKGWAAGSVTGQTTLAVVTLKRGKATWTFPPTKLRPGTCRLTASCNGYDPVTTANKKFVVTR